MENQHGFAVELPNGKFWQLNPMPSEGGFCKVTRKERDATAKKIRSHLKRKATLFAKKDRKFGVHLVLRFSLACFLKCDFCFEGVGKGRGKALSSKRALSFESIAVVIKAKVKEAKRLGESIITIKVSGGEPTMFPKHIRYVVSLTRQIERNSKKHPVKFKLILETAGDLGLSVKKEQLGFASHQEYWSFIADNFDAIRFSYDGCPSIQEITRKGDDPWEILDRIQWMCEARLEKPEGVEVYINAVIPSHLTSEIYDSALFLLNKLPGSIISFSPVKGDSEYNLKNFYESEGRAIQVLPKGYSGRVRSRITEIINQSYVCGINTSTIEVVPAFGNDRHGCKLYACPLAVAKVDIARMTCIGDWNLTRKNRFTFFEDIIHELQKKSFDENHPCVKEECPAVLTGCGGGCEQARVDGIPFPKFKGACEIIRQNLVILTWKSIKEGDISLLGKSERENLLKSDDGEVFVDDDLESCMSKSDSHDLLEITLD